MKSKTWNWYSTHFFFTKQAFDDQVEIYKTLSTCLIIVHIGFFCWRQPQSQSLWQMHLNFREYFLNYFRQLFWEMISTIFCNPVYLNLEYLRFLYGVFQSLVLFFILFCTFFCVSLNMDDKIFFLPPNNSI